MATDEERRAEKQLSRNWEELLQELRVAQTGIQILTGFLLTIPFTARFTELNEGQQVIYLLTIAGSVVTTGLIMAPVAFHRVLFRRKQRLWLVEAANTTAKLGLFLLAATTSGVILLVFDVVLSWTAGLIAAAVTFVGLLGLWVGTPVVAHRNGHLPDPHETTASIRKATS
ncbi:MAG TPA: DUF6328 family protein [Aeromicrobium sp.]|nr:DUF6328 family protein [Aeromicrobium sp.]